MNFGAGSTYGDYCLCHMNNLNFLKKLFDEKTTSGVLFGVAGTVTVNVIIFLIFAFYKNED